MLREYLLKISHYFQKKLKKNEKSIFTQILLESGCLGLDVPASNLTILASVHKLHVNWLLVYKNVYQCRNPLGETEKYPLCHSM